MILFTYIHNLIIFIILYFLILLILYTFLILFHHLYFLILILPSWSFFYYTDLNKLNAFWNLLLNYKQYKLDDIELFFSIKQNLYWIILSTLLCIPISKWIEKWMQNKIKNQLINYTFEISLNCVFLFISTMYLVGSSYNPFLYFRF